jgi:hypothetical protein
MSVRATAGSPAETKTERPRFQAYHRDRISNLPCLLSDMANISRAKDAAISLVLGELNGGKITRRAADEAARYTA